MAILDWDNFERIHGGPGGSREEFENVCLNLIRKKSAKNVNVQKVKSFAGDHGIDIYTHDLGIESIHIYQCKYFRNGLGDSQKDQIRKSFSSIICDEKYEVHAWTLMFPQDMTFDENKWWCDWKDRMHKRTPNIELSCLCGRALIQELMEYGLYERYFNSICNEKYWRTIIKKENADSVVCSYMENYTKVLFLQEEDEPQIRLMDVYIEPEYEIFMSEVEELDDACMDLTEYIQLFSNHKGKTTKSTLPVLFIEGDAGIGKTTFISKIAYEYKHEIILKEKKLYIICLRNLLSEGHNVDFSNPWMDFYRYLVPAD